MKNIIAAIAAFAVATGAQAQSSEAVMNRAVKTYSEMSSLRAEFRQTITNPLTGTSSVSRGVMLRKDPNLLSINFSDPKGDRVVSDGKTVWVYIPSSAPGQVIKMPAGGSGSMAMVDPGGMFLSSPSSRYTITGAGTATVGGRKTSVVNLVPKKSNNAFTRAKVWVDATDGMIRQFEVVDANGLTRLVTITSIKPNASIAASEFRFTPPKNARVLDSTALPSM
ncbi:MAG: outer membrane lipoprotein chaperone LolA [Gemmatimonadales bacterium]